jgi:nickel superoxide dismutase
MAFLQKVFNVVDRLLPARVAYAHCDIPCGIYDPHLAQIAALTAVRMNQLIQDVPKPGPDASEEDSILFSAKMSRYIAVKEQHAELCKHELRVIWGDYIKPQHVENFPNVHELFWKAMQLGSKTRQEVNMQSAQDLLEATLQIAEIFWKTKGVETVRQASNQTGGGELVFPVAKS